MSNSEREYLNPGEKVLWEGRPDTKILFAPSDLIALPFALLLTAFASLLALNFFGIFVADPRSVNDPIAQLVAVVLLLIALYLLAGRFLIKLLQKKRTTYVLTESRVLIVMDGVTQKLQSIPISPQLMLEKEERKNGSGTIFFGVPQSVGPIIPPRTRPAFVDIPKVKEVFGLIQSRINPKNS